MILIRWYWSMQICAVMFYRAQFFQQSKTVRARRSGQKKHLIVGRPWQTCAVGMVRQFQETENGNRWILVLTDHFTCWCDALPTPNAKAETVARILDERVFSYFGIPENLHSDQGKNFDSDLIKECSRIWGTLKVRTTPYAPTANGVCEIGNKVIGASLRALLFEHEHKQWDRLLPQIMRTVRSSPHETTGELHGDGKRS